MRNSHIRHVSVAIALLLTSCAAHKSYRPNYELCNGAEAEVCAESAQHVHDQAEGDAGEYYFGFIEFDDQGQLWDRKQADRVMQGVGEYAVAQDLLLLVYVHGWKHNAKDGDGDIAMFQESLRKLTRAEASFSRGKGSKERKVAGIYCGWRGASMTWPLLKEFTFWDRKSTAHAVGHGGITEVLSKLEAFRDQKRAIDTNSETRLVTIGHSFGGAIVYSALGQLLTQRFVETKGGVTTAGDVGGFGDLVVLINPAFEAQRFSTLSDMSVERGQYDKSQRPVLAILTSESDWATKKAFPFGRFFSTLFDKEHPRERWNAFEGKFERISQGRANRKAVGHFNPFTTHKLIPRDADPVVDVRQHLQNIERDWRNDTPGESIEFSTTELIRSNRTAPRNPYLVIRVDKAIIPDHSTINGDDVLNFLTDLILLTVEG